MRNGLFTAIVLALCTGCSQKPTADQSAASGKNVTAICRAILDYEGINKSLPLRYTKTKDGKPGLSWRVTILPMLRERELYTQFHLDEPWDSPGNKALITKMPGVYKSPMGRAAEGFTNYLAIATPTSAWSDDKPLHIRNILDGARQTISVVEVDDTQAVEWTKPADYVPNPSQPFKDLGTLHPKGAFIVGTVSGDVHFLQNTMDAKTFAAFCTRNGQERADWKGIELQ